MRKLFCIVVVFAGACKSTTIERPPTTPAPLSLAAPSSPGASSAREVLGSFLAAIRAQDLQALALAWGDKNGPARDSKVFSHQELEQRELILMPCLKHDTYRVLSEAPAVDGERLLRVELTKGTVARVTDVYAARGSDRWYVRSANLAPLMDICSVK